MGILQHQNLTLGFSQPDVTYWESTSQLSSSVSNVIFVLVVLTFALQLCLVLFFMLRCWRLDNRVREAVKHPDTAEEFSALSIFQQDIYERSSYQLFDAAAVAPAAGSSPTEYEPSTNSLYAPSIPWDLVQG